MRIITLTLITIIAFLGLTSHFIALMPKKDPEIMPDYELTDEEIAQLGLEKDLGAVRIPFILAGTVAEKSGLKPDDLIIEFNSKKIPRKNALSEFKRLIRKVDRKKPVPIVVIREGNKITLTAHWDE